MGYGLDFNLFLEGLRSVSRLKGRRLESGLPILPLEPRWILLPLRTRLLPALARSLFTLLSFP